jgi:hypothetical protein
LPSMPARRLADTLGIRLRLRLLQYRQVQP